MKKYTIILYTHNGYEVWHLDRPTIDTIQRADLVLFNLNTHAVVVKNRWGPQEAHDFTFGPRWKEEQ